MTASDREMVPVWLRRLGAVSWRVLVLIALGGTLTWVGSPGTELEFAL